MDFIYGLDSQLTKWGEITLEGKLFMKYSLTFHNKVLMPSSNMTTLLKEMNEQTLFYNYIFFQNNLRVFYSGHKIELKTAVCCSSSFHFYNCQTYQQL